MKDVAVHPAELDRRSVADLGANLIRSPVTVRELKVDRSANALPAARLPVETRVVQRVENSATRLCELVQEVPLAFVVEENDVQLVREPG